MMYGQKSTLDPHSRILISSNLFDRKKLPLVIKLKQVSWRGDVKGAKLNDKRDCRLMAILLQHYLTFELARTRKLS